MIKSWIFDKDKGATTNNNEIEHTKNALLSYFGRIQYALMDRYLMTIHYVVMVLLNLVR